MVFSWWSKLTKRPTTTARKNRRTAPRPSYRLVMEKLEDRLAPATDLWVGPAGGLWSVGSNWSLGTAPVFGDAVLFDPSQPGGTNTSSVVDAAFTTVNAAAEITSLSIASGYTQTITLQRELGVGPGNFAQAGGTFDANGNILTSGNTNLSGGTYLASTATQALGAMTVAGGTFIGGSGELSVSNVSITSGTLTAPTSDIAVFGNFSHTGGTFNANGGLVGFAGANQTISGSTTFHGLQKTVNAADTLTFQAGQTQTVTGTLTLQGAAGQLLKLRSSTPGTQWQIDPQGTRAVSFVDVQDSDNVNATAVSAANSVSSGNNTNWLFTGANGALTYNAGPNRNITIDVNGANVEIKDGQTVVASQPVNATPSITINGSTGETLTVDNTAGAVTVPTINFDNSTPTNNKLVIKGGSFTTVTETFTGAHDGNVALSGGATVNYTNLTPVDMTGTTAGNLVFNLPDQAPPAGNQAFLEDDGTPGNGVSQIRSGNGTFETTTFSNPTGSVTINAGAGDDTVNVGATPDLTVPANLNGQAGNDTVVFANGATLHGGTVDGGTGTNSLDYSAYTTAVAVNLGTNTSSLVASLDSDQEVPPHTTAPTGTATITYNNTAHTYDITLSVTGIAPTDPQLRFHIHRAPTGVNGPIISDLFSAPAMTSAGTLTPTGPTSFTFTATGVPLSPLDEAALLGGITYLNVHDTAFPGGEIRGQIFPGALFAAATGTATGTGGIANVENVTGGMGADSLVGDGNANVLRGGPGNDVIVGARGADTMQGEGDDDTMVWSNGDGSDVIDGGVGNDLVNVNGALGADDVFTIGAGAGGRVAFARTSPGPFTLDIGTAETLAVNGATGNDTVTLGSLVGVTNLTALNLFGFDGNDTFNVHSDANVTVNVTGHLPRTAPGDTLNFDAQTLAATDNGSRITQPGRQPVNYTEIESVNLTNTNGVVAVTGTNGPDTLIVTATSANSGSYRLNGGAPVGFSGITMFSFTGLGGNDTLIVNNPAGGLFAPSGGITYDGGPPFAAPGDALQILGGTHTSETHNFAANGVDGHNGSIVLVNGAVTATYTYTGLDPILVNAGTPTDVVFNLPPGPSQAVLQDDGGAGMARLHSADAVPTFEDTDFVSPSNSLTINRGNAADTLNITVTSPANFGAGLTVGTAANLFATITVTNPLTLNTGTGAFALNAGAINLNAGVSTTNGQTYNGAVTLGAGVTVASTAAGNVSFTGAVNGGFALTVNTGGVTTFGGAVGTTPLTSLSTDPAGTTVINGGAVTTTGAQTYGDAVTLGAATVLTAGGASSSAAINNGGFLLTISTTGTWNAAGVISGAGALTKAGAGTLTLGAANTFGGATTVNAGTLADGIANALPTGTALTVAAGATYDLAGFNQTVGSIAGAGSITDSGAAATLTVSNAAADTFAGTLTGANLSLAKSGAGMLTLTNAANTYGGSTIVTGGTLADGVANALPTGTALTVTAPGVFDLAGFNQTVASVTGNGTVTDSGAAATFTVNNAAADTFAGTLTGSLGLTKTGAGTLTLGSANSYSGPTNVNAGTLADGIANALPVGTALTVAAGATYDLAGFNQTVASVTGTGTVTNSNSMVVIFTVNNAAADTFAGTISGNLSLNKNGAGTLTLSGATNSYTGTNGGATAVIAGTLANGVANALPVASNVTVAAGATYDLAGFNQTVASISGQGTITDSGAAATLTVNNAVADDFVGSIIGANLALTKTGAGTLRLTGANPFGGATQVNAGTLLVEGSDQNSAVTVGNTTTLAGNGRVGAVNVNAGGTMSAGDVGGPGPVTGMFATGNLTLQAGANFTVELNGTTPGSGFDQVSVTGTVNLGGATLNRTLGFESNVGDQFLIINNDGADAVTGTFNGLPEGATFNLSPTTNPASTEMFRISYVGGDGNDVVLRHVATMPGPIGLTAANGREGTTPVTASGTISDADQSVTSFTLTINWGDGTVQTFPGQPRGPFSRTHTYAEEGRYTVTATVSDNTGDPNGTRTESTTATVLDEALTVTGIAITPVEGQSFSGAVATFTDAGGAEATTEYSATIAWGDGTTTAGAISVSGTTFTVSGTHTYAQEGPQTVVVTVVDLPDAASPDLSSTATSSTAITVADAPLSSSGIAVSQTEGIAFTADVATFTDAITDAAIPAEPPAEFAATIDWGDGSTSAGTISAPSAHAASGYTYTVSGTHTYAEDTTTPGRSPYTIKVTITDTDGSSSTTATTAAVVADAPLTPAVAAPLTTNEGTLLTNVVVGNFTDANRGVPGNNLAADFTATIDWGDGTLPTTASSTAGTIVANGSGGFSVLGTHTYFNSPTNFNNQTKTNTYNITVKVADEGGSTTTLNNTATVKNVAPTITQIDNSYILTNQGATTTVDNAPASRLTLSNGIVQVLIDEGQAFTLTVKYTDPGGDALFATVIWGDNTQDTVALPAITPGAAGTFALPSHTYQHGIPTPVGIAVFIQDQFGDSNGYWSASPAFGQPGTQGFPFFEYVLDRVLITPSTQITVNANADGTASITNQVLGTFTDQGAPEALSNYTAVVNWGDGTFNTSGDGKVSIQQTGADTYTIIGVSHTFTTLSFNLTLTVVEATTGQFFTVAAPLSPNLGVAGQSFLFRIFQDEALNASSLPNNVQGKLLYYPAPPANNPITSCDNTYLNFLPVEGDVFTNVISSNASKLNVGTGDPVQFALVQANVVQQTLGSRQFLTRVVRSLYCEYYGEDILQAVPLTGNAPLPGQATVQFADPSAQQWVEFLAQSGSIDQLRTALLTSPRFINNVAGGLTNQVGGVNVFVDLLFQHLRNQSVFTPGQTVGQAQFISAAENYYVQLLTQGFSPLQVATALQHDQVASAFLVNNLFLNFLKRTPTPQELAFFEGAYQGPNPSITENQIIFEMVTTQEFFNLSSTGSRT